MKDVPYTDSSTAPKRKGFYEVRLVDGRTLIADWRDHDKQPVQWWQHVGESPTAIKQPAPLVGVTGWRQADKAAVEAALRRELTVDEHIEAAVAAVRKDRRHEAGRTTPVPSRRTLQPGEHLELGNLAECTVVALRDEGQLVVVSYRDIYGNYGKPLDLGIKYRAVHWTEVVPTAPNRKVRLAKEPTNYDGYRNSSLQSLLWRFQRGLDDNPTYQRGYAWGDEDKARLLDSLFNGREIGRFMFVCNPYPQVDEILDGKQRLTCLWELYTSQIAYQGVFWHELSPADRNCIENLNVQYADLNSQRYSRADLLKIFLEVNAAGVPQTEEHLQFVRDQLAEELTKPQLK